jgi:glycosyltransferase involved in cell wall biosynthesis
VGIRVLQALSAGQFGGTELMVHELLQRLDRHEVACDVSVLDGPGPLSDRFTAIGVPVHDLHGEEGYRAAASAFRSLLRAESYDLIHLYGFRMSLLGRFLAPSRAGRPVIAHGIRGLHVTEGTNVDSWRTRAAVALERVASPWIDAYIANSQGAMDFLTSRGLPRERFHVVRNGIDTCLWRPAHERDRREVPLIVAIANFRPVKRLVDLVDALGALKRRGVRFRATLVGEGALRRDLESRVALHDLGPSVSMPGQLPSEGVRALLDSATVFTLPSLWEGMPVSVMEAMSMALPVVGTDVPGVRELVVPGETGLLVAPGHPDALAGALQRLLESADRGAEMGRAARRRMVEFFDVARMVSGYESLYRSLVACHRS